MRDLKHICEGIFDEQEHELELHTLANLQRIKKFNKANSNFKDWTKDAIGQELHVGDIVLGVHFDMICFGVICAINEERLAVSFLDQKDCKLRSGKWRYDWYCNQVLKCPQSLINELL